MLTLLTLRGGARGHGDFRAEGGRGRVRGARGGESPARGGLG